MVAFQQKRAERLLAKGRAAVMAGDYVNALHEFKAAAFVCRSATALTSWGTMEYCMGDTKQAIELCRQAIDLDPEHAAACNDIGFYLVALGKADEAIPWFERATAASMPGGVAAIAHVNLGRIFLARRDYDQALAHCDQALQIDPGNAEALDLVRTIRRQLP